MDCTEARWGAFGVVTLEECTVTENVQSMTGRIVTSSLESLRAMGQNVVCLSPVRVFTQSAVECPA